MYNHITLILIFKIKIQKLKLSHYNWKCILCYLLMPYVSNILISVHVCFRTSFISVDKAIPSMDPDFAEQPVLDTFTNNAQYHGELGIRLLLKDELQQCSWGHQSELQPVNVHHICTGTSFPWRVWGWNLSTLDKGPPWTRVHRGQVASWPLGNV